MNKLTSVLDLFTHEFIITFCFIVDCCLTLWLIGFHASSLYDNLYILLCKLLSLRQKRPGAPDFAWEPHEGKPSAGKQITKFLNVSRK
jgi:hypothetical protein